MKIIFDLVLSTPDAKFFSINIAHFYLCTPLDRFEYMQLTISIISKTIIDQYNLRDIEQDGWVYIEIRK